MLIVQAGFCASVRLKVRFCLETPLFLEPTYQKTATFYPYQESCYIVVRARAESWREGSLGPVGPNLGPGRVPTGLLLPLRDCEAKPFLWSRPSA